MIRLLLQLLGVQGAGAGRIVDASLELRALHQVFWVLPAASLFGWLLWRSYRRAADLSAARRFILMSLRGLFAFLLLAIFLRPAIAVTVEGSARRALCLLLDSSASMGIVDRRTDTADRARQAIAKSLIDLGSAPDASEIAIGQNLSRRDLVQSVLENPRLNILPQLARDHDVRAYAFSNSLTELSDTAAHPSQWLDRLSATGTSTALGDSIRQVLSRSRGQGLAGIILATDGVSNSGSSALAAAEMARSAGVPLYIYGVGISAPRDVVVASLFARDVCFIDDAVPVLVRVRGQGMTGQSTTVRLKVGDKLVDEKPITFTSDAELAVPMSFTPREKGDFQLAASIEPRDDEAVKDNNSASQPLHVVDAKIKVLYVEQSPRWEFRYLQALLLRDRRLDAHFVLLEGDPGIASAPKSPFLPTFPQNKEDLFKFDLVILGDVDPSSLTSAQIQSLVEFVSRFGGGLLMIPGRRFGPQSLQGTALASLLPVEIDASSLAPSGKTAAGDEPIRLQLTPAGKQNPMLKLSDKREENEQIWANLPSIYWTARATRAKPGAEVLAIDPDPAKSTAFGKMPVIALQPYGLGQVLYVGTDNTWRWRKNTGDQHHTTFWGQIVQTLSLPHLLGQSKRTQLSTDRTQYVSGERVAIYARLYGPDYRPLVEPTIPAFYKSQSAPSSVSLSLRALPEQPGIYRGELLAGDPGTYQFWIAADPDTRLEFSVGQPRQEFQETAMNEPLLRQMAEASGGAFFREEDLHQLPTKLQTETQRVRSSSDVEIWSSPLYFLLMLVTISAEWIVRKASNLK
jgi:hypothetical protein